MHIIAEGWEGVGPQIRHPLPNTLPLEVTSSWFIAYMMQGLQSSNKGHGEMTSRMHPPRGFCHSTVGTPPASPAMLPRAPLATPCPCGGHAAPPTDPHQSYPQWSRSVLDLYDHHSTLGTVFPVPAQSVCVQRASF